MLKDLDEIFIIIFNTSITACYIILAVIALRFLLRKVPKYMRVILWGLAGIRLIFPFSIESIISLIPSSEVITKDIMYAEIPKINSGIGFINSTINPVLSTSLPADNVSSINPMQVIIWLSSYIWVAGILVLIFYGIISYNLLKRKVLCSIPLQESLKDSRDAKDSMNVNDSRNTNDSRDTKIDKITLTANNKDNKAIKYFEDIYSKNIYQCEQIESPFILGIIKPKIYIPFSIDAVSMKHVISHEMAHIKRKDYLIKPLAFLILAIYWFNPLIRIAYILLCRDIEYACDEKVICEIGIDEKKFYSKTLLSYSVSHKRIMMCPIAFGEIGVKQRIKNVLSYKKPAFWVIICAAVMCIIIAICFLTNPKKEADEDLYYNIETDKSIVSNSKTDVEKINKIDGTDKIDNIGEIDSIGNDVNSVNSINSTIAEKSDISIARSYGAYEVNRVVMLSPFSSSTIGYVEYLVNGTEVIFNDSMFLIDAKNAKKTLFSSEINYKNPQYTYEEAGDYILYFENIKDMEYIESGLFALDISSYHNKAIYHIADSNGVNKGLRIYLLDDEIWIGQFNENPAGDWMLNIIYSLKPKENKETDVIISSIVEEALSKGVVGLWYPVSDAKFNAFEFEFMIDNEYAYIEATTDYGKLIDYTYYGLNTIGYPKEISLEVLNNNNSDFNTAGYPEGKSMKVANNKKLYWEPLADGHMNDNANIKFEVFDDSDKVLFSGIITISCLYGEGYEAEFYIDRIYLAELSSENLIIKYEDNWKGLILDK